jgi:hypothetical protein
MSDAGESGNSKRKTPQSGQSTTISADSLAKKLRKSIMPPALGVSDAYEGDVKSFYESKKDKFRSNLRLDRGSSKADNWSYSTEDKTRYLVLPKNYQSLFELDGYSALLSLIFSVGTRVKVSDTEWEEKDKPKEINDFFAGLSNRLGELKKLDSDSKLRMSGQTAMQRGRQVVDLLILKKFSKDPGIEKYLPPSILISGKTPLKHYLGLLGGADGIKSLKNVPDFINHIINTEIENNAKDIEMMYKAYTIPYSTVISDLVQRKNVEKTVNRKKVSIKTPVNLNKISDSPFILSDMEKEYFKSLEKPWSRLEELQGSYKEGVCISDLSNVRKIFKQEYQSKRDYVARFSAFKSRRLTAFKTLASFYLTKKEFENWRLSRNTAVEAKSALADFYKECQRNKDWEPFKKLISNLSPKHIDGLDLSRSPWQYLNSETIRKAFGDIKWYTDTDNQHNIESIYKFVIGEFPDMIAVRNDVSRPSERKRKGNAGKEEAHDQEMDVSESSLYD